MTPGLSVVICHAGLAQYRPPLACENGRKAAAYEKAVHFISAAVLEPAEACKQLPAVRHEVPDEPVPLLRVPRVAQVRLAGLMPACCAVILGFRFLEVDGVDEVELVAQEKVVGKLEQGAVRTLQKEDTFVVAVVIELRDQDEKCQRKDEDSSGRHPYPASP